MEYLLKCVNDSPNMSMERIGRVTNLMEYANLDENIKIAKTTSRFVLSMIAKCDELQHDLLELIADWPQLEKTEKKKVMNLHDAMTATRIKYQNNRWGFLEKDTNTVK